MQKVFRVFLVVIWLGLLPWMSQADDIEKINLNTATAEQLQTVKGIGPVLATRIIEYRGKYGQFIAVDELIEVKGIGKKKMEKYRPQFFVEPLELTKARH